MRDRQIEVQRVPPHEREPDKRFQVVVEGSVISRHATQREASERAREAAGEPVDHKKAVAEKAYEIGKIGTPVDATLETMNETGCDRFAAGGRERREPTPEERGPAAREGGGSSGKDTFDAPDEFNFFGSAENSEENGGNDLEFDDPLGLGGGEN